MKLAILSRTSEIYSTRRLFDVSEDKGHEVRIINPAKCLIQITDSNPHIIYEGQQLPKFDAVIPRVGTSLTFYGASVVRQFEMMKTFSANGSKAILRARDKIRSLQLLSRANVPLPNTLMGNHDCDENQLLKFIEKPPYVIKLIESSQGQGVFLCHNKNEAIEKIKELRSLNLPFLVQEFIAESDGRDIRCFVINGQVVASMNRIAKPGDFRANLHQGGTAINYKLNANEEKIALKAAAVLGLDIAGVDLILSKKGPLVLEVNASPGLEGIESVCGIDIATKIVEFVENVCCS